MKRFAAWIRESLERNQQSGKLALNPEIFSFDIQQADELDHIFHQGLEEKINDKRWVEKQMQWIATMAQTESREPERKKIQKYDLKAKSLAEIAQSIGSSGGFTTDNPEFRNMLYVMYVLDTALQDIDALVPNWKKIIQQFKENCFVFPYSKIATLVPSESAAVFLDIAQGNPGRFNFILNDYLTAVHEIAHGLVYTALRHSDDRAINTIPHQFNDFYKALQEAVAISLEQAIIRAYNFSQPPHKVGILFGMMRRGEHALNRFQAIRRKKSDFRKAHPSDQQVRVAGEPVDSYAEGVRIARWFERHGWTVSDIPVLLGRLSKAGQMEIGKQNLELLVSIPTREPDRPSQNDTPYMRIIRRALKK